MNDKDNKEKLTKIFRLMLALTIAVTLICVTFIVFSFIRMAQMELFACLVTGISMLIILALVSLTLWFGIRAFRE
ncbi:MAG: hypothetical protein J6Y68_01675 [Clostridia bacterium]|nr:hypothetical protein [Clostridia bacterium]MBP5592598.1 hypothetical protein [Clostridia bacterium]MBP5648790.1 hypothetical protein [Clostridia bacterium]